MNEVRTLRAPNFLAYAGFCPTRSVRSKQNESPDWCSSPGELRITLQKYAHVIGDARAAGSGLSCWPRFGANPLKWS